MSTSNLITTQPPQSAEVGHRFLVAAHDTFALLATQPDMGWRWLLKRPELQQLRIFRVKTLEHILILYLPLLNGVDILRVVHGSRNLQALFRRESWSELAGSTLRSLARRFVL
jgi:toxin ParE1/3/4